jgi:uncharacterized membrane protein
MSLEGGIGMTAYVIALRILHIVAGTLWVGSTVLFLFFVQPATAVLGPAAGSFMVELNQKRKTPIFISVSAVVTILAGVLLYWRDSSGFDLDWITSPLGLGFTIGAVAAIVAFLLGFLVVRRRAERMGEIGAAVQASGAPPSREQAEEMQAIQRGLRTLGMVNVALLIVAVVAMATARYL